MPDSLAVTLRFDALTAVLHCPRSPSARGKEVELHYRGEVLEVGGANAVEQAGRIWSWCEWQSGVPQLGGQDPK